MTRFKSSFGELLAGLMFGCALVPGFIWLSHVPQWWAPFVLAALASLILGGAMHATALSWALDDFDVDERPPLRFWVANAGLLAVIVCIVPAAIVVKTSFGAANAWPFWFDVSCRVFASTLFAALLFALLVKRGTPRGSLSARARMFLSLILRSILIIGAALPWLASDWKLGMGAAMALMLAPFVVWGIRQQNQRAAEARALLATWQSKSQIALAPNRSDVERDDP